MEQEALYTIGQVSKICDVSQRMLRYYEKVGLITPDHIAKPSHYRYYSVRTMQRVQVIKPGTDPHQFAESIYANVFA